MRVYFGSPEEFMDAAEPMGQHVKPAAVKIMMIMIGI